MFYTVFNKSVRDVCTFEAESDEEAVERFKSGEFGPDDYALVRLVAMRGGGRHVWAEGLGWEELEPEAA